MSQLNVESAALPVGPDADKGNGRKSGALAVAGVAGAFASVCCIGPLVLVSIGLGGASAGIVAAFEPLRPVFIVIALAALAFAGWKIYRRPVEVYEPGAACAVPQTKLSYEIVFWVVATFVLLLLTFPYYIALFY